ncbi:MAG: Mov34/MPN/PAD-1 family protein [Kineosporiaceae bacterium]|nr:Mov34/MPN/PAD-1 family protein [Kineosporiaceae bacterium]MBK8075414.1 Mov34/MPN/PAD-1 family protein [Kineosporiaceae bacterium]
MTSWQRRPKRRQAQTTATAVTNQPPDVGGLPVQVHPDAHAMVTQAASAAHPQETGGLLLGWWQAGSVVLRYAVEVIDPDATSTSWHRQEQLTQAALIRAIDDHEHPWLGYVGDWHTHPAACPPSRQDEACIREASTQFADPLVLLVHRFDGRLDIRAARAGRSQPARQVTYDPLDTKGC